MREFRISTAIKEAWKKLPKELRFIIKTIFTVLIIVLVLFILILPYVLLFYEMGIEKFFMTLVKGGKV